MADPLHQLLFHTDARAPVFTDDAVRAWPDQAFDRLRHRGLLRAGTSALIAACPDCPDGHQEEVITLKESDGNPSRYIYCPAHLRVPVTAGSLRRWEIDFDRLARLLAESVRATGQCQALISNLLWRLGKVDWRSAKREALFARCLQDNDSAATIARIESYARPILFVPSSVPLETSWTKHRTAVVSLTHVAKLGTTGIEIDPVELLSTVTESDDAMRAAEARSLTRESLTNTVRRSVKSEMKSVLNDDDLVRAYRSAGSYRKAAEELSKARGIHVTKDQVYNAVDRSGGTKTVLNQNSSNSIVRNVASQKRDRHGKAIRSAQPESQE